MRDSNLSPRESWISYKKFSTLSILIDFLNLYIDLAFLTSGLSLFH